jgi:hypothetical protein
MYQYQGSWESVSKALMSIGALVVLVLIGIGVLIVLVLVILVLVCGTVLIELGIEGIGFDSFGTGIEVLIEVDNHGEIS